MSDDESPQKDAPPLQVLSKLGTQVLTRIVRELASFDCLDYESDDPARQKHTIFAEDLFAEHGRNLSGKKPEFYRAVSELEDSRYIQCGDSHEGLTIKLNPACTALEGVRQKIYKDHIL